MLNVFIITAFAFVSVAAFVVDLSQNNRYSSSSLLNSSCNKDMEVSFKFDPTTVLTCASSACSISPNPQSSLYFLDVSRQYLDLSLRSAQVTADPLITGYNESGANYYVLHFVDQHSNQVDVMIPFVVAGNPNHHHILTLEKLQDSTVFAQEALVGLGGVSDPAQGVQLSYFDYLNLRDYGQFYQVANSNKNHTILINAWILNFPSAYPAGSYTTISSIPNLRSFQANYSLSADRICYASYASGSGAFQNHLRENWPLWTCFFIQVLFWAYYLIRGDRCPMITKQQLKAKTWANKWTSWGLYSLYYAANDECFSRMSRLALLHFTHSIQGTILAALYVTVGARTPLYSNYSIVVWFAIVAAGCSFLVPFLMGLLLIRVYTLTLEQHKKEGQFAKKAENQSLYCEEHEAMVEQIYKIECRANFILYWYYIIIFFGFMGLWAGSIHLTLWLPFKFYYLQRLWLVSFAISFVIENLILDPVLTALFGEYKFYQSRGFYCPFHIAQLSDIE